MSLDSLNISASALYAQRVKMDTIASNMANVNTTRNPDGTPGAYRRKEVIFAAEYGKAVGNEMNVDESKMGSNNGNPILKGRISSDNPMISSGVRVVQVSEDNETPMQKIYNPTHPDADKDGYVEMPNINIVSEMVDMLAASKAYEANVTAIDTTKSMISAALRI